MLTVSSLPEQRKNHGIYEAAARGFCFYGWNGCNAPAAVVQARVTEAALKEQLKGAEDNAAQLSVRATDAEALLASTAAKLETSEQRATEAKQQIAALQDEVGLTETCHANLATHLFDHPVALLIRSLHNGGMPGKAPPR